MYGRKLSRCLNAPNLAKSGFSVPSLKPFYSNQRDRTVHLKDSVYIYEPLRFTALSKPTRMGARINNFTAMLRSDGSMPRTDWLGHSSDRHSSRRRKTGQKAAHGRVSYTALNFHLCAVTPSSFRDRMVRPLFLASAALLAYHVVSCKHRHDDLTVKTQFPSSSFRLTTTRTVLVVCEAYARPQARSAYYRLLLMSQLAKTDA